ncbi:MAG: M48 family metallopeptidase [Betaproteobacteria bacterium]|nr:M48 family metallopeptidase [Betaproteobacteria bacterium]
MKKILCGLGLAGLAACTTNPITGRSQFTIVSEDMAIGSSASAYSSMMSDFGKSKKIEAGTARDQKVHEITERLIAQAVRFRPESATWKWQVQVIDDPKTVNAFCMAGGKMAIYTGIWEKLHATDDEVAQVMGHEIGHALLSHTREKMSVAYGTTAGAVVGTVLLGGRDTAAAALESAAQLAIALPNSRQAESEADQVGIELAARAGYDPQAAVTLWDKMGKLGGTPPEFLSTHPSPEHRRERLEQLGRDVEPLYLAAKSGPPSDAPSFLSASAKPGALTREQYAARVSKEADTMTFRSAPFTQFRTGTAEFKCRTECAFSFASKKGDWKKLHAEQKWRELALSVMGVGYLSDLSYFMLAEAANGLGLPDAAKVYYQRAVDASAQYGCASGFNSCEGFDVQRLSAVALKR